MRYTNHIRMMMPVAFFAMISCSGHEKMQSEDSSSTLQGSDELTAEVDTMTLWSAAFTNDVVSNGRIKASEYADINFRTSEIIDDIFVHNGQHVKKGQQLARLNMFKLDAEKTKQEAALAQARLEMQDVLIGRGYNPEDLSSVPDDVMKLARIRSGLEQAETNYNTILKDIENATLTAPFDGVVANVKGSRRSMASMSEPFCRIINDNVMGVEFSILESELSYIHPGSKVEITPYNGGDKHYGTVSEINPMIDESGHVKVNAKLNGASGLIDGMNVRIRSSQSLGDRLIVPKSAVVLRTGRQVAFTYEDGKAMWNYVTTGLENLDSYEITDGLTEGVVLIISGNENLAHEAPVKLIEKQ